MSRTWIKQKDGIPLGKILTFFKQAYEIVYVKGNKEELRRLYRHLRAGG